MTTYDPERVLAVACPTCGVQPGEQCLTASGRKRNNNDFHATRKGVVYPSFATKRRGLSDPRRKAINVLQKLDDYLEARLRLARSDDPEAFDRFTKIRGELLDALQEGFK